MSLLVMNVLIAGNCLAVSEILSVAVFQRRPRSQTFVFGSLVLSCLVTSWIRLLFVDQDLRLSSSGVETGNSMLEVLQYCN